MRSVRNNGFSSAQGHSANLTSQGYRKAHQQHRKLQFEPLEQRALLSVDGVTQISGQLPYFITDWYAPQVSDDGRYVAFSSRAGLVAEDTNRRDDVYVADLETGQVTWISQTHDGSQPDDGSWKPEISPDGRYVAFMSRADNLLPEDLDPSIDLFVYDRVSDSLKCITADVDGDALSPRFSGDNQKIVYEFEIGDTAPSNPNAPTKDIILYDRTTGSRLVVSRGYDGQTCNGICWRPDISRDGGTIVFQSRSSNLQPNDISQRWDVYLYDVAADTLECVSTNQYGVFGNGESTNIHVSADGRFVTFQSRATNLDAPNTDSYENIFLLDRVTGDVQSVAGDGTPDGASAAVRPGISNDGRYIVYTTSLPGQPEAGMTNVADVYVYDRLTLATRCVTVQTDGTPTSDVNAYPDISGNGGAVIFLSDATTLTDGPIPSSMDVFVMPVPPFPDHDFGDAPAPYPTLLADSGASHFATGPILGSARDAEDDGQPSPRADGDDMGIPGDDEDGVATPPLLAPGIRGTVLEVTASGPSFLNAWIDFDTDGIWEAAERIAVDQPLDAGVNQVTFDVPQSAEPGFTYARLRLTSYDNGGRMLPYGLADDGEVEDYHWAVENAIYLYGDPVADDVVSIRPSSSAATLHEVDLNGTVTTYDPAVYHQIHIDTLGGNDQITVHGTGEDESVTMAPGSVGVVGESYQVHVANAETVSVNAGTGNDQVTMTGSAGSNRLYSYADSARMTDSPATYSYRVDGFGDVTASAPAGGRNYAFLYDSPQDDWLDADPTQVVYDRAVGTDDATTTTISGFERVYSYATAGGADDAVLTGSATGANRFYSYPDYSTFTDSARSFYFYARGFDTVTGNSAAVVTTTAYLYDSPGNDTFVADPTSATMDRGGSWPDVAANGFNRVYAYSTRGGSDTATLIGSAAGGNQYRGYPTYSTMTDAARSFYHYASSFRSVTAVGSQGDTSGDCAYLYDSSGDDTFDEAFFENGKYQGGSLTDAAAGTPGTYENLVKYFDLVYARSTDRDTDDTIAVEDEELLAYRLLRLGTW